MVQLENDDLSQRDQIEMLKIETASQITSLKAETKTETKQLKEEIASQKAEIEELRSAFSTQSAQMAIVMQQLEQLKSKVNKDQ